MSKLDRLEEFKWRASIQIDASSWLTKEADNLIAECEYYNDRPHLDSHEKALSRLHRVEALEQKLKWEDKSHKSLVEEFKDVL